MAKQTQSSILAQEIIACGLAEPQRRLQLQAIISGILFANPGLDDFEIGELIHAEISTAR
jgi:hypothetical protein